MAYLYLISPPRFECEAFLPQLEAAFMAGEDCVGAFQLRLKSDSPSAQSRTTHDVAHREVVLRAAEKVRRLCDRYEVAFFLNDSADLARECGADGVHLGQEDGDIDEARKILGDDAMIGISCHDSYHLAMEAAEAGANYVAFGAFFPTTSKTPEALAKWGTPTVEMLHTWSHYTHVPCVAIGGVTPANCDSLLDAGADFLAVISAVWQYPEGPAAAVAAFGDKLRRYG